MDNFDKLKKQKDEIVARELASTTEYKIGDRVIHHGHITEVVGVQVKYMLCGGAVVYAHDLKRA